MLDHPAQCKPDQSSCSWHLSFFGTPGAGTSRPTPAVSRSSQHRRPNLGSYVDPTADDLITSRPRLRPAAMQTYGASSPRTCRSSGCRTRRTRSPRSGTTCSGVVQDPLAIMHRSAGPRQVTCPGRRTAAPGLDPVGGIPLTRFLQSGWAGARRHLLRDSDRLPAAALRAGWAGARHSRPKASPAVIAEFNHVMGFDQPCSSSTGPTSTTVPWRSRRVVHAQPVGGLADRPAAPEDRWC